METSEDVMSVGYMFAGIRSDIISREVFEDWLDVIKLGSYRDGVAMTE